MDVVRGLFFNRHQSTLYSSLPCPNCKNPTMKLLSKRTETKGRRTVCPNCGYILEEQLRQPSVARF